MQLSINKNITCTTLKMEDEKLNNNSTFFKDFYLIFALLNIVITLFIFIDYNFESQNTVKKEFKEYYARSQKFSKRGNSYLMYSFITNDDYKILLPTRSVFVEAIQKDEKIIIYKTKFLNKNKLIKINRKGINYTENISILNLKFVYLIYLINVLFSIFFLAFAFRAKLEVVFSFLSCTTIFLTLIYVIQY